MKLSLENIKDAILICLVFIAIFLGIDNRRSQASMWTKQVNLNEGMFRLIEMNTNILSVMVDLEKALEEEI